MRQDDKIEICKVNALRLNVGGEDVAIIAGVEQDSLAGDLDERGETPILLHRGVGAEGVVEDGDLALGLGSDRRSSCGSHGGAGERTRKNQCYAEFHGTSFLRQEAQKPP